MADVTGQDTAVRRANLRPVVRRLARNRLGVAGIFVITAFILVAVLAPVISPQDPLRPNLAQRLAPPSSNHIFGTDEIGRDLASRVIHGARISLMFGVATTLVAVVVGLVLGLVAGYFGGVLDDIVMRGMDLLLIFPDILLAIAIVSALGPGLTNAMIAIAVGSVPMFARTVRAQVLSVRQREFITASKALGARNWRVIMKHVLPNTVAALTVLATLRTGTAILSASTLSFLGLGVEAPTPEWGAILAAGRNALRSGPHVLLFPGAALSLVVIAFASVGDALRDALDPRTRP